MERLSAGTDASGAEKYSTDAIRKSVIRAIRPEIIQSDGKISSKLPSPMASAVGGVRRGAAASPTGRQTPKAATTMGKVAI